MRCIESVAAQHYENIEHWIIDDGSTDSTPTLIERAARTHPFIRHHRFDLNRGVNAARNYAIQHSLKNFVLFLDSDDYLTPNALETIHKTIAANPGYPHYLFAQDDRMPFYNQNPILRESTAVLTFADFLIGRVSGDFAHVIASDLIKQFRFDEYLRTYEALTFFQILKSGGKQFFVKQTIVNRDRGRPDSVTLEYRLYHPDALNRQYSFLRKTFTLFHEDYFRLQALGDLSALVRRIFLFGLALGKYEDNDQLQAWTRARHIPLPLFFRLLNALRMGWGVRQALFAYSYLKNKLTTPQ
jgi:glycosyltransferase involved in cell wall biosynthesis